MNKIVVYLRLSKEDYNKCQESESIGNQRKYLTAYIQNHKELKGMYVEEYVDDGYSGGNFQRPSFQRMLEDVKERKIHCIIVKDLSRFSRDYIETGNFLENIFPFLGIRFIAINDHYDSAIQNINGMELNTQFKTLLYELYIRDLSERIKKTVMELKSQGKNINGHTMFGYLKDNNCKYHIIIDEKTAPIVKEAYQLILQGYSCGDIANIFNEKGYITPSERKEELQILDYTRNLKKGTELKKRIWTSAIVSRITNSELYTGDYIYNKYRETKIGKRRRIMLPEKDWKKIENTHEAIISREDFKQVQEMKKSKMIPNKRNGNSTSIFSKKVICEECGRTMGFRKDSRKKPGKIYKYRSYFCRVCQERKLSNRVKEQKIIDLVKMKREELKMECIQESKKEKIVKINYSYEIDKINSDLQSLYEQYKKTKIEKEEYLKEKEKLQERKIKLEVQKKQEAEEDRKQNNILLNSDEDEASLREFADKYIDKIIVSRQGKIELQMRELKYSF